MASDTKLSPLERKLALAPLDDEPVSPEEAAAMESGVSSLKRNGGTPMEEVLTDFGLTLDDLRKMPDADAPEK